MKLRLRLSLLIIGLLLFFSLDALSRITCNVFLQTIFVNCSDSIIFKNISRETKSEKNVILLRRKFIFACQKHKGCPRLAI